ncbi:unnamed protein product [Adineta ricciae]|uniref:Uncharacterized protein n=1 Tax=Adineta ricciae TaxID=249248 RepID=A0A813T9H6_ADIRI|nr:unnamed protein product [Adineta ricciae]CAF1076201.1 unnamed protein product [Adineta ricciae]
MNTEFSPGVDPEEIKQYLHGLGLIPVDEYYIQLRQMLKRQEQSSKTTNEQIQRKLAENGIHKDDLSKNFSLLCPRKRVSFSPVITRKAIKKRTPSASQLTTVTTTVITSSTPMNDQSSTQKRTEESNIIGYDQPLDLRVRTKSASKL